MLSERSIRLRLPMLSRCLKYGPGTQAPLARRCAVCSRASGPWTATSRVTPPRVAVVQDLDNPPCRGSFWGEVNSNIHRALGFVGTVTNGSARDLDEMEALGFFVFAGSPSVSHAYVHLVDFGGPVRVGGEIISPGDLLHGDQHGAVVIPNSVAGSVADAAAEVDA